MFEEKVQKQLLPNIINLLYRWSQRVPFLPNADYALHLYKRMLPKYRIEYFIIYTAQRVPVHLPNVS